MYTIYHNGSLMYSPEFDEYTLEAPTMTLEANKFGTLQFTIYPDHPNYSNISKITSVLSVYKDGALYRQFRPTYSKRAFRNGITHKCESVLARLNDFQFRPFDYISPENVTNTIEDFVETVLDSYNARVDSSLQILKGNILVTDPNNYVHYSSIDYLGHWDVLKTRLVDTHGGYFMERYSGGHVYLDYLREEDLPTSTQAIRFGENLTDLFIETDSANTFSVLVPTGADIEVADEYGETHTERLTIKTVNGGLDYIESAAGIALYGRRETTQRWQDVTVPQNLLTKAQEYLQTIAVKFKETVSLDALDLHNADSSIVSYNWMDKIPVQSAVHDLNETYILQRITLPLSNPLSGQIQLGETRLTLTDRILGTVSPATQNAINETAEQIHNDTEIDLQHIRETLTMQEQSLRTLIGNTETAILLQVVENFVGSSEFAQYQSEVGTQIVQTQNSITATASSLEQYVDTSTSEIRQYVNGVQTYMRYSTAGLELGQVGSGFMTRITNTRISFLDNNQEVAYISNQKLYVTEAQITSRLIFGTTTQEAFAWVTTPEGLGLKWVGETT